MKYDFWKTKKGNEEGIVHTSDYYDSDAEIDKYASAILDVANELRQLNAILGTLAEFITENYNKEEN